MIDGLLSERRVVDVSRQRSVKAALAKCGTVTDRQVDHALPGPGALPVREVLAAGLPGRGKLRRIGRVGYVLEQASLAAGAVERPLGPAQHLDALQVPGVEITGETEAVGERVARAEGRIVDIRGHRRAYAAHVL